MCLRIAKGGGAYECVIEPLGSTKCGEFHDQLRTC
jgi:hypothetical protein